MDPYVGEIRLFAGNFAPRDWAICDGSSLSVISNTLLFSVIGNQFGGDGVNNFNLPDLRNRVPMHQGAGQGLTPRAFASTGGEGTVTLDVSQMPNHSHQPVCLEPQGANTPTEAYWAKSDGRGGRPVYSVNEPTTPLNTLAIGETGENQPHNNMQPYLALNFIIALQGVFPPKS